MNDRKNKLKILFLADDKFPPFRVDVSVLFGTEMLIRGHTIDWLLQSDKETPIAYQTIWKGSRAYVGRADNRSAPIYRVKNHILGFIHDLNVFRLLNIKKYDCVIVRDKFISALIVLIASKIYNTKFIYWLSYPFPEDSLYRVTNGMAPFPFYSWIKGHVFKILLYRIIVVLAEHVFVQTERMKKNIVQQGVAESKMTSVPMAVQVDEIPFFGYKSEKDNDALEKKIVYLGTLVRTRKLEFMIRVFAKVIKELPSARLYLVGGSPNSFDEQLLRYEAKSLGVENAVIISGFLPQKEAWQLVKGADVCVSPIYCSPILTVGSPTKLYEYMAMGKAVVANDHPEQKDVLNESSAGICVPWDEKAFAEAIIFLNNNQDEAKKMGVRGRKYIEEKRSYKQMANIVEETIMEVCNMKKIM